MKLKHLSSVEPTSAPASLRLQMQTPPYDARDVLREASGSLAAVSSVRELHDVAPLLIQQDSEQRPWLRSPRLIGERGHRFHFLPTPSIDYLQVDGNYVTIHVGDERYLARATLKYLSDALAPFDFMRIDRSVLINLQQVEYIERLEGGRFAFQLRCGHYLVSNRERRGAISRLLRSGIR
jgi:DNA-binding LytR/AlgR family response regulator